MNGNAQVSQPPPPPPQQHPPMETPLDLHNHQPPSMPMPSSFSSVSSPALQHCGPTPDHQSTTHLPKYNDYNGMVNGEIEEKWGTHVMGTPAVPTCHPNNRKAPLWAAGDQYQYQFHHYPYLQYSPLEHRPTNIPLLQRLNSRTRNATAAANNVLHNLKTGPSVPGAAWAKVNLTAKAIAAGGFESLYRQAFNTSIFPDEKLKKTFACYLSTSTGPVAGTLYLSNLHLAFCSDRPLSFTAPSGLQTLSYYKILIPLGNIGTLNPVIMTENPRERYIQAVTVDGQDFWFMGFVNYEKATRHLFDSISKVAAVSEIPLPLKQHYIAT